jgi:hypothetical protein
MTGASKSTAWRVEATKPNSNRERAVRPRTGAVAPSIILSIIISIIIHVAGGRRDLL